MALQRRYNEAVTVGGGDLTVLSLEKSACHSPCFYATVLLIFVRAAIKIYTWKMIEKCVFINEPAPPHQKINTKL